MITKKEKQNMIEFISQVISNNKTYNLVDTKEEGLVLEHSKDNKPIFLFLHTQETDVDKLNDKVESFYKSDYEVGHILYNNEKDFMRKLTPVEIKEHGKSLKLYSEDEIKKIILLSDLEKNILDMNTILCYYQPKKNDLNESLQSYYFEDVVLNFSHLLPENSKRRLVLNEVSEFLKRPFKSDKEIGKKDALDLMRTSYKNFVQPSFDSYYDVMRKNKK
jgi:hypothetical protein